jgi:multidrug efflux pump
LPRVSCTVFGLPLLRELEIHGRTTVQAAMEAARLRLRPILMTSFAFIMGIVPLVLSSGAGAEMRHAMDVTVFFGMLGVTFFGLFLTPVFYLVLRTLEKSITRTELVHHHVTTSSEPAAMTMQPK